MAKKSDAELRDHFAGLAMAAMISNSDYDLSDGELARAAYRKADAMLRERVEVRAKGGER